MDAVFRDYFVRTAGLIDLFCTGIPLCCGRKPGKAGMEELRSITAVCNEDILPENYGKSYANPSLCRRPPGKGIRQMLSFLAAELRSLIAFGL